MGTAARRIAMTIPVRVSDKDLLNLFELVTAHRDEDPGDRAAAAHAAPPDGTGAL
jgi:hypothetical protein